LNIANEMFEMEDEWVLQIYNTATTIENGKKMQLLMPEYMYTPLVARVSLLTLLLSIKTVSPAFEYVSTLIYKIMLIRNNKVRRLTWAASGGPSIFRRLQLRLFSILDGGGGGVNLQHPLIFRFLTSRSL
jgi:hypothetical protein